MTYPTTINSTTSITSTYASSPLGGQTVASASPTGLRCEVAANVADVDRATRPPSHPRSPPRESPTSARRPPRAGPRHGRLQRERLGVRHERRTRRRRLPSLVERPVPAAPTLRARVAQRFQTGRHRRAPRSASTARGSPDRRAPHWARAARRRVAARPRSRCVRNSGERRRCPTRRGRRAG